MHLHDESPVLRGGVPDAHRWQESLLDAFDIEGRHLLSVNGFNRNLNESDEDLYFRVASIGDIKHGKVSAALVSSIRNLGLEIEHDPSGSQAPNHFHIVFPDEPTTVDVQRLIDIFSAPFPNPTRTRTA